MTISQVAIVLLAAVAFAAASTTYPAAPYKPAYPADYKPAYPAYKEEYVSCLNLIEFRFILT
jgi:hypothetical protein